MFENKDDLTYKLSIAALILAGLYSLLDPVASVPPVDLTPWCQP
jgi:hypothetical protein